jgi:sugar lactone lactonase YvrE
LAALPAKAEVAVDVAAELKHGPSGLAVAPDGSLIVGIHQCFKAKERVVRVDRQRETTPFPSAEVGGGTEDGSLTLDAVMGIQAGPHGVIWMLDNGRRTEQTPKLVGWNAHAKKAHRVFHLPAPATVDSSFVADLAVDPAETHAYISDPAAGGDAALIVLDLRTGVARRVLQGHASVVPEGIPLVVGGERLEAQCPDGSLAEPLAGVNPIAVDRRGKFVYYGPMKSRKLYRIPAAVLQDAALGPEAVAAAVETYAEKPVCDSIAIDAKDNIYVGDLSKGAIQVIGPKDRNLTMYLEDPKMAWPDGLTFGADGRLYFYCSQVNRCSWFSGGKDGTKAPFLVYRVKPLYQPLIANPLPDRNPLTGLRERIEEAIKP